MDLNAYMTAALRTSGHNRGNLAYSMGGVGGEAGEYVDVVKKHLFHGRDYAVSRDAACKELGDLLWGIAQAADAWGLDLETVASVNVAKLRLRYPDGFSAEAAAARVDEQIDAVIYGIDEPTQPGIPSFGVERLTWDANGSPLTDADIDGDVLG